MFPAGTAAATLSLCIPPLFPQLHLQAQLHPPGAVGYWVREFRWKHPTDHSSQQTPVPGAPERTKGRHVSPQHERKRVSAKARLCANHGWGWGACKVGRHTKLQCQRCPAGGGRDLEAGECPPPHSGSHSTRFLPWTGRLEGLCFGRPYPALGSRLAGQGRGNSQTGGFPPVTSAASGFLREVARCGMGRGGEGRAALPCSLSPGSNVICTAGDVT